VAKYAIPSEVEAIFMQAVKNAEGTPPRKHHLVPASYLRRWAEGGKVRVTVVDEGRSYLPAPETAARETDYYRLDHPDIDPEKLPPLLIETVLSRLEDNARMVIDELLKHRNPEGLEAQQLVDFVGHLAFSWTRGKGFRDNAKEMFADLYRMRYEDLTDDGIRARLRKSGVEPTADEITKYRQFLDGLIAGDIVAVPPEVQVIATAAMTAAPLGEYLLERTWVVYETPPILVTCDEPVISIGGPGSPRSERSGLGIAGVVIFPLSPSALLVMFHPTLAPSGPSTLDLVETAELNREIIASATRWAFERPSRHTTERMRVPPLLPKASLREGPLPQVDDSEGELYRIYTPTRWLDADAPPWPVARWWRSGWTARQFPRLSNLPPGAKVAISPDQDSPSRKKKKPAKPRR
jgi:hypothetical protein